MVGMADDPTWGNACPIARGWGRRRGVTTKLGGMCKIPILFLSLSETNTIGSIGYAKRWGTPSYCPLSAGTAR
jgi:hypothetical protein